MMRATFVIFDRSCQVLLTDVVIILLGASSLGSKWFAPKWSDEWKKVHICIREHFPIVIALELWGSFLCNRPIKCYTDNMSIVHVINKKTPKDKQIMNLLHKLVTRSVHYNIVFEAQHIQGLQNVIADKLSRFQLQDLRPSWTKTEQTSD